MSVNIVLPPLFSWATSRLTGLLESKTQDDFNTAFDATFATQCSFTVNAKSISREAYKAHLLQESAAGFEVSNTAVHIGGQTQVQTGNEGQLSGLVGIFYTAVSDSYILVLGFPTERKAVSSLNLVIEPTEERPPNPHGIRSYFDPRRVTGVNQVVSETMIQATIPASFLPKTKSTATSSSKVELGPEPLQIPADCVGRLPPGPFGGHFGPGPVRLPPGFLGATPERLPGDGAFGPGPVIAPGETVGEAQSSPE